MRLLVLGCLLLAVTGCGKKGPPLTPFVRIPAAVAPGDVRRIGNDVYLSFTVPTENVDKSMPADVRRIEGTFRTVAVHPGGVVIADQRIDDYVPLELAPKGVVVTLQDVQVIPFHN